jgi:uncharacterized protein (TIRG00374 family)
LWSEAGSLKCGDEGARTVATPHQLLFSTVSITSEGRRSEAVVYDVPERTEIVRSPVDVLRFVVSFGVAALGVLLIVLTENSGSIWDRGIVEFLSEIESRPIDRIGIALVQVTALSLPVIVIVLVWWREGGWRPLLIPAAIAVGAASVWAIEQVVGRAVPAVYLDALNSDLWLAPAGFPSASYIAGTTAGIVFAGPYLSRRWRRASWVLVWAIVLFRVWSFTALLLDAVVAVSVGWMIGAAILYAFGAPNRTPRATQVIAALERAGIAPASIEAASVDARASSPYFVSDTEGNRFFIKVLSQDQRSADLMFRLYRWIRMKNIGDERSFSSLRRSVEHEALVSYHAMDVGVSTPSIRAVTAIGSSAMLLAYDAIDLRTLAEIDPDELADRYLPDIWAQVAKLQTSRCAHRDLRLANLAVDADGSAVVVDFGFSELAASDALLDADVAELLLSSATVVGAQRAVDIAVEDLGQAAVVAAGPWMQPGAVSGATRTALKDQDGLLAEIQDHVRVIGDSDEIEFVSIERIRPRTIAMLVGLGVAFYLLIPQLAEVDFGSVSRANPLWVGTALLLTAGKYLGNSLAVHGSVPKRLPLGGPFVAELASTFANRISPAKVGGLAVNMRYLEKSGVEREVAVAGVGLLALVSAIVHFMMLVVFAVWVGKGGLLGIEMPSGDAILVGLVAILTIAGIVVRVPKAREFWRDRLYPAIRKSADGMAKVASSPARVSLVFGGTLLAVVAYVGALYASLEAFGGGLAFATVGVVYLAGSAIGGLAPIPGGIGSVEAALIAALTAFGLDASVAVPGVLAFRIVSFWIPIIPGWLAMTHMERTGSL